MKIVHDKEEEVMVYCLRNISYWDSLSYLCPTENSSRTELILIRRI